MILPVYAYGQPVLKKVAKPIEKNHPNLEALIENMWGTMYKAEGVGIAAPQVGKSIRLFVIDTIQVFEDDEETEEEGFKRVFINAEKIEETGEEWEYEEGCLSIPDIRGDVTRPRQLKMRWVDENFEPHEEIFNGINARVVQHEYDHLEGVLFTEKLKPLKKSLIKRKLSKIRKGKIKVDYKMKFSPK